MARATIKDDEAMLKDKRVGKLIVKRYAGKDKDGSRLFYCDCDCGTKDTPVLGYRLRKKRTRSCGCLQPKIKKRSVIVEPADDFGLKQAIEFVQSARWPTTIGQANGRS